MEAFATSAFIPEICAPSNSFCSIRAASKPCGLLRLGESCNFSAIRAFPRELSAEDEEGWMSNNVSGLLPQDEALSLYQVPGWTCLSNARVTIFGDVYPLPDHEQECAHKQYFAKHQQRPSQQWGNFYYFRMQRISDIFFIGGFRTVAWVDVKQYENLQRDKIALYGGEQTLKMNNYYIVLDCYWFNIQRISFREGHGVETLEQTKEALWKLIKKD